MGAGDSVCSSIWPTMAGQSSSYVGLIMANGRIQHCLLSPTIATAVRTPRCTRAETERRGVRGVLHQPDVEEDPGMLLGQV